MGNADIQYDDVTLTKLAFGSCHKNKAAIPNTSSTTSTPNQDTNTSQRPTIWNAITKIQPQTFLWLGDAIYSPDKKKSIAPVDILKQEYLDLVTNSTIGYTHFLKEASSLSSFPEVHPNEHSNFLTSIHGTHDDHDYGANDYGKHMPGKEQRKELFLKFLRSSNEQLDVETHAVDTSVRAHEDLEEQQRQKQKRKEQLDNLYQLMKSRDGLYSSIEYGTYPKKVKVILLDTRSGRDDHCPIPSIGAVKLPFKLGSPLACVTRWITAGLNLQNKLESCHHAKMLSEQQWTWLEQQLKTTTDNDATVYVIGSSVQVLTTSPVIESWGHYPEERFRLLKLLNNVKKGSAVVILSGDVHHAEILDSSAGLKMNGDWNEEDGRILEVTSSGLTHSCVEPFYGPLCGPILDTFPHHRYQTAKNYFTGKNFGSIEIKWDDDAKDGLNNLENGDRNLGKYDKHQEGSPYMQINIHNLNGDKVLTTGSQPLSSYASHMTDNQLRNVIGVSDGHLIPYLKKYMAILLFIIFLYECRRLSRSRIRLKAACDKKKKIV